MLSAVVITSNAKDTIGNCLDSLLEVTSDVIVVDSGSDDGTKEICISKNIRYYFKSWEGYAANKNFGNDLALNDYVISMDSDEILSAKLIDSIKKEFDSPNQKLADAYLVSFIVNYCGKWIRYGDWRGHSQCKIFNRKLIHWQVMDVHEVLSLNKNNSKKKLEGNVLHYSYPTAQSHLDKIQIYTDLFADRSFKEGKKSNLVKAYASGAFSFVSNYFLKLGFLDGYFGFIISRNNAYYTFLKYQKLSKR